MPYPYRGSGTGGKVACIGKVPAMEMLPEKLKLKFFFFKFT